MDERGGVGVGVIFWQGCQRKLVCPPMCAASRWIPSGGGRGSRDRTPGTRLLPNLATAARAICPPALHGRYLREVCCLSLHFQGLRGTLVCSREYEPSPHAFGFQGICSLG